jgi:nucleoside-diphosphate-sugar epimerase
MRGFVTGATGFIGSAVVRELIDAGHEVIGLARSDAGAAAVKTGGAAVLRGSLEDLESLRLGAEQADGVIHAAYIHDFSRMEDAAAADRRAIETFGTVLEGSDRPLVFTTGAALASPGRVATEEDRPDAETAGHPRAVSEQVGLALADRGVRVSVVRPGASVHGQGDHGFVPHLIAIARSKGVSGYIGDGSNRWPAVHRLDTARLYRLALEHAAAGSVTHAVAESVATREIAEVIGRHLNVPAVSIAPAQAGEHFGWMARFWALDAPASSALTQERMGWTPEQVGLIEDLEQGHYFQEAHSAAA